MQNKYQKFIIFFIVGVICLTSSFYNNNWSVVEPSYYRFWERNYERVVVARLAQSRQHGIFSAGGLLGLADLKDGKWDFNVDRQYDIYLTGERFEYYSAYKSHPGFQGFVVSVFDLLTDFTPAQNVEIIRFSVAILSAMMIAAFAACLAVEFGWVSALLVLVFSASSEWMILPASNAYWSLWAFYFPFVASVFLLGNAAKKNKFSKKQVYGVLFLATLLKVLFTGFEMITTVLIMTTVPFVFYAINDRWGWKVFVERVFKLGSVLLVAAMSGMAVLAMQIAANSGGIMGAVKYILNTFYKRAAGNPENYKDLLAESMRANVFTVLGKYLGINAFNTQTQALIWQAQYWQLVVIFIFFTIVFIVKYRIKKGLKMPNNGLALVIATWYSIIAPLSWYIIFKPTSYIHTFLFPMAWQMPFVLMGFALCGYVIQDFFRAAQEERP